MCVKGFSLPLSSLLQVKPQTAQLCETKGCAIGKEKSVAGKAKVDGKSLGWISD